jgi:hypothetical protein
VWLCEDAAVDFDLTRLGDREFEHLSQALALQVLGAGVTVFGEGPDGGREATFEGRMHFPGPGEPWNGYGVVQFTDRGWPNWSLTCADAKHTCPRRKVK